MVLETLAPAVLRQQQYAAVAATDGIMSIIPVNVPAAIPTVASAVAAAAAKAAQDASVKTANEDKTTALVVTCSVMLSVALLLRLAAVHMQRSTHTSKSRRVCGGRFHFKTVLHALDVSVYIVLWYAISIGMTLFNKWFLRVWADGGYPFATTMTCLNMFIKCLLSRIVNYCSSATSIMGALTAKAYWRLAVPIGLCTALDIMLSNLSFFYITVTFYTIVKSGGNVWCVCNESSSVWGRCNVTVCMTHSLSCLCACSVGICCFRFVWAISVLRTPSLS